MQRWRASASQQQVMCCTVSFSILQNLQDVSPLNRPMIRRYPLTGACPVRIATAIFTWCLPNLSRSSALFLHGLPIKSLPCLQPGTVFQVFECWYSVQLLIASLARHLGIPRAGSGPSSGIADACLASLSAILFPRMPWCPGTQTRVTSLRVASAERASWHSSTSLKITFRPLSALSAAWLSEKIRIACFYEPFLYFRMHTVWHKFQFEILRQICPKKSYSFYLVFSHRYQILSLSQFWSHQYTRSTRP